MYHESLDEVNKVKSVYEAKLIEANNSFRTVKAENEVLKKKWMYFLSWVEVILTTARNKKEPIKPKCMKTKKKWPALLMMKIWKICMNGLKTK